MLNQGATRGTIWHAALANMSLASTLAQALRPAVPPGVLKLCREHDRAVVENILYVTLEILPQLSLDLATCEAANGTYSVTVPLSGASRISLSSLRRIAAHAPSRIQDVHVESSIVEDRSTLRICIVICDETTRASFSEYDVVRVSKRTRPS